MRFVIVTGMSGAGKTTALKMLEDTGAFAGSVFTGSAAGAAFGAGSSVVILPARSSLRACLKLLVSLFAMGAFLLSECWF